MDYLLAHLSDCKEVLCLGRGWGEAGPTLGRRLNYRRDQNIYARINLNLAQLLVEEFKIRMSHKVSTVWLEKKKKKNTEAEFSEI